MEEKQKVFIRGCKGRGSEIHGILTGLGATATNLRCDNDHFIYFINHDNEISVALVGSEVAKIIMDNYKEIELPQQPWKDRDILVDEWNTESYAVFKEYGNKPFFRAYFVLLGKEIDFDELLDAEHYRLANVEEMRKAPMLFYFLFNNLDAVRRCLPKKVEQTK